MEMRPDCLVCLFDQALRVAKALECDDECALNLLRRAARDIEGFSLHQTPPEAAAQLYPDLSALIGIEDLYWKKKIESTNRAFQYLDFVWEQIDRAPCKIDAALRAAVAGNVLDFATQMSFPIEEEIEKIFQVEFAIDEKREFIERLKRARRFMIIGDNVGEHLFDKVLLEVIEEYYPELDKYYVVRGRPIINDVTAQEARAIGIDTLATIVDSGVDTPGFLLERANRQTQNLFGQVDLILAKGMGNFECMDNLEDDRVFHLFKVKCSVVSDRVGAEVGSFICLNNANIRRGDE
ncbi:MAG: DUF89 family protein [Epsilonproteobacteria bacterium]|nr:hypothetical protein [Campylobacterota bacterium]NPA56452.1 DUF89 family protein [Campylobacterota bacterium]